MRLIAIDIPDGDLELASDHLRLAGARAIEERSTSPGRVELRTVLSKNDGLSLDRLGSIPDGWAVDFVDEVFEPAETWREFAEPIRVAPDLVIRPAWIARTTGDDVVDIPIEPGGAFGLGDHPTTRLSAAMLHRLITRGDRVLDVGCGTGVLSVLAARRGALHVTAVDVAEAAREATIDNARRNGVEHLVSASTTSIADVDGTFDVVVANILAPVIISMSADLVRLTGRSGRLIVSGILATRHGHVVDALSPLVVVATEIFDEWAAIEFRH